MAKVALTVRIEQEEKDKLKRVAKQENRSITEQIQHWIAKAREVRR